MTTRSQFWADRQAAGRRGPEGLAEFNTSVRRMHEQGVARGGLPCCGTTGIWHAPWCALGPWEPESTANCENRTS
jgi:hypothetical protein